MCEETKITLRIYGVINDIAYQMMKTCAEDLHGQNPEIIAKPSLFPMLEFEWSYFISYKKKEINGELWAFNENAIIYANNFFIGGAKDFLKWAQLEQCYENFRPLVLYNSMADKAYETYLKSRNHEFVFLEFTHNNEILGKIIIELFNDLVPKTCRNFRSLCTEECGFSTETDTHLSYKTSTIHRIVDNGWIQGGDIVGNKGCNGESIYGKTFEDENFVVEHNRPGIVGMANNGRHTNASQFYITLQTATWMNKKFVAFGQIIDGSTTMEKITSVAKVNERPVKPVIISDCGFHMDALNADKIISESKE